MIPEYANIRSVWPVLPPGIHNATLQEIEDRFATNHHRRNLFEGFKRGVAALVYAGCKTIFLDGSFVTGKTHPKDFDVCWDPTGVDDTKLDPVFLDFTQNRKRQKDKFSGEFFPSSAIANGQKTFIEFFQTDRYTGVTGGLKLRQNGRSKFPY